MFILSINLSLFDQWTKEETIKNYWIKWKLNAKNKLNDVSKSASNHEFVDKKIVQVPPQILSEYQNT